MNNKNRTLKEVSKAFEKAAKGTALALNEWCEVLESFSKKQKYGVPKMRNIPPSPKKKKDV